MELFKKHWGAMAAVGQFDSFPFTYDDYYVYINPTDGLMSFLPWGMDETFVTLQYWVLAGESLLPDACQKDDPCRFSIVDKIWEVVDIMENAMLVAEFDQVQTRMAPWIALDPKRPYTDQEVAAGQAGMRSFIENRRTFLMGEIPGP